MIFVATGVRSGRGFTMVGSVLVRLLKVVFSSWFLYFRIDSPPFP